jgi:hypothetical protein
MSASKVSATVLPCARDPFLKTGVSPPGPGASVGAAEAAEAAAVAEVREVAVGAGWAARADWWGAAAQAVRAAPRTQAAVTRRTRVITV